MRRFAERSRRPLENIMNSCSGQDTETKMVWPRFKVFKFSKAILQCKVKGQRKRRGGKTMSKSAHEWTLLAQLGRLKTRQDVKGLLRTHLWCPDDLPRSWDRIE